MQELIKMLVAIGLTMLLGHSIRPLLRAVSSDVTPSSENKKVKTILQALLKNNRVGQWIGRLERLIFLAGFWIGEPAVVAGWFGFKIATKWTVWKDIVQIPDELKGVPQTEWFLNRHTLGTYLASRFLVGTVTNALIALVSWYVGINTFEILKFIGR